MLDQPFMTDIIEASSISHMPQLIDIYSASWGPTDNGKTVDGPRELTLQAMADGVNKVRGPAPYAPATLKVGHSGWRGGGNWVNHCHPVCESRSCRSQTVQGLSHAGG